MNLGGMLNILGKEKNLNLQIAAECIRILLREEPNVWRNSHYLYERLPGEMQRDIQEMASGYSGGCAVADGYVGAVCAYLADHAGDLIEHDPKHLDLSQHPYEEDYFRVRPGYLGEINNE